MSPVNHKRLHQGWTQISLYLLIIHFTSHHTTSHAFLAYFYSAGTQHGNLYPAGWPILLCGPTQETCVSHSQHRRNRESFFFNKCRWMDWKGRNKQGRNKFRAVSVAYIAMYWPTPGFKGRTFKLCVLARWDFNFCGRSSPLSAKPDTHRGHVLFHNIFLSEQNQSVNRIITMFLSTLSFHFISTVICMN